MFLKNLWFFIFLLNSGFVLSEAYRSDTSLYKIFSINEDSKSVQHVNNAIRSLSSLARLMEQEENKELLHLEQLFNRIQKDIKRYGITALVPLLLEFKKDLSYPEKPLEKDFLKKQKLLWADLIYEVLKETGQLKGSVSRDLIMVAQIYKDILRTQNWHPDFEAVLIRALSDLGPVAMIAAKEVNQRLYSKSEAIQLAALYYVSDLSVPSAAPLDQLLKLFASKNNEVKRMAMFAIAHADPENELEFYKSLLVGGDSIEPEASASLRDTVWTQMSYMLLSNKQDLDWILNFYWNEENSASERAHAVLFLAEQGNTALLSEVLEQLLNKASLLYENYNLVEAVYLMSLENTLLYKEELANLSDDKRMHLEELLLSIVGDKC